LYWAYICVVSLLALHKFVVSRPLVLGDFYTQLHMIFFAWRQGPPDAWLLKQLQSLGNGDLGGSLVFFRDCFEAAQDTMNEEVKFRFIFKIIVS